MSTTPLAFNYSSNPETAYCAHAISISFQRDSEAEKPKPKTVRLLIDPAREPICLAVEEVLTSFGSVFVLARDESGNEWVVEVPAFG